MPEEPVSLTTVIASGLTLIGVCFTAYLNFLMVKLRKDAKERADASDLQVEAVQEVAADLAANTARGIVAANASAATVNAKLDDLAFMARATRIMVIDNIGVQLRLNKILAGRLAEFTHDPVDVAAAETAAQAFADHFRGRIPAPGQPAAGHDPYHPEPDPDPPPPPPPPPTGE